MTIKFRKAKCQIELGDYQKAFQLIRSVLEDPDRDPSSLSAFKALNNEGLQKAAEEKALRDKVIFLHE